MIKKELLFIVVLLAVFVIVGCKDDIQNDTSIVFKDEDKEIVSQQLIKSVKQDKAIKVYCGEDTYLNLPLFTLDSYWNMQIINNPQLHYNSEMMVNQLIKDNNNGANVVLSVHEWSTTLYFADKNTKRTDVYLKQNWWQKYEAIINVPIPSNAQPDPSGDGHMCIIDTEERYVYEFWQAYKEDDIWYASWGNRISLDSDGIYPNGMSARGSGFPLIAGMIFPEELKNGKIEHALIISLKSTKAGGPVYPATESDGYKHTQSAIPIGARIILNPNINLDDYNLTSYERTICECLQTYGAYVGDTSSSIEFEAINPISYQVNPYGDMFNNEWIIIENIPIEELQVLDFTNQIKNPKLYVVDELIYK